MINQGIGNIIKSTDYLLTESSEIINTEDNNRIIL